MGESGSATARKPVRPESIRGHSRALHPRAAATAIRRARAGVEGAAHIGARGSTGAIGMPEEIGRLLGRAVTGWGRGHT